MLRYYYIMRGKRIGYPDSLDSVNKERLCVTTGYNK